MKNESWGGMWTLWVSRTRFITPIVPCSVESVYTIQCILLVPEQVGLHPSGCMKMGPGVECGHSGFLELYYTNTLFGRIGFYNTLSTLGSQACHALPSSLY